VIPQRRRFRDGLDRLADAEEDLNWLEQRAAAPTSCLFRRSSCRTPRWSRRTGRSGTRNDRGGSISTGRDLTVLDLVGANTPRMVSSQLAVGHATEENHRPRIVGQVGVQSQLGVQNQVGAD
jgi:hypothetical protein